MLKRMKQKITAEKKVKATDSTVKLITKELLNKLGITLPLDENSANILAEYFEAEEISLAQNQDMHIPYNEQYMNDICRAVDDFYPCGDWDDDKCVPDLDDLNARLG